MGLCLYIFSSTWVYVGKEYIYQFFTIAKKWQKKILAQNNNNKHNVIFIVLMSWLELCESDKW